MASGSDMTLDSLETPTESSSTAGGHIHYPIINTEEFVVDDPRDGAQQPRQLLKDRLYIGNLHPSVDEYSLLQVFSKFGKVTKLDFLFHKAGALKGKPRGYAFVEYGNKDEALKALTMAHDKSYRGRKLVVTFAHQAPLDQYGGPGGMSSSVKNRKTMMETGRPTTLSMLKTGAGGRHDRRTVDKIAMMEAKLRQMEATNPKPAKPPTDAPMDDTSIIAPSSSSLPYHPSLPAKPLPALPEHLNPNPKRPNMPNNSPSSSNFIAKPTLPSLPMVSAPHATVLQARGATTKPPITRVTSASSTVASTSSGAGVRPNKSSKLIGVKIKPKDKDKEAKKEAPT